MTRPGRLYDAALHTPVLGRGLNWLRWRPVVRRGVRRWKFHCLEPGCSWHDVDSALRSLRGERDHRVVFGPWTGSLELELLFWLPFVRWAVQYAELHRGQAVAISRSGAARWYEDFVGEAHDLGSSAPPEIAASAVRPELVTALWQRYLSGEEAVRQVLRRSRYERLPVRPREPGQPAGKLAVTLALGERFPDTAENRALVARVERALAGRDTFDPGSIGDLAARADAVAASAGLVATWSDDAVLGPLTGVPTLVLGGTEPFGTRSLDLLRRVARELDGSLAVVDATRLDAHAQLFAGESVRSTTEPVPSGNGRERRPSGRNQPR